MKLSKLFKRRQMRGKSKSPEQKFKEKKASVDGFLLDTWLKQLRQDPTLAERIAEKRYGSEAAMPRYGEGEYESPDLLEVLRQAAEAKKLLKGELGEGRASWLSDIAEIMRSLPQVLSALPQLQQVTQQQQRPRQVVVPEQIAQGQAQVQIEQQQPQPKNMEVSLEALVPLINLEPADAWQVLNDNGESGWTYYLSHTSLEEVEKNLAELALTSENPAQVEGIKLFLQQKHVWLRELVELAHAVQQN